MQGWKLRKSKSRKNNWGSRGRAPWRGQGAEPLVGVRGQRPLKLKQNWILHGFSCNFRTLDSKIIQINSENILSAESLRMDFSHKHFWQIKQKAITAEIFFSVACVCVWWGGSILPDFFTLIIINGVCFVNYIKLIIPFNHVVRTCHVLFTARVQSKTVRQK